MVVVVVWNRCLMLSTFSSKNVKSTVWIKIQYDLFSCYSIIIYFFSRWDALSLIVYTRSIFFLYKGVYNPSSFVLELIQPANIGYFCQNLSGCYTGEKILFHNYGYLVNLFYSLLEFLQQQFANITFKLRV